jgi:hypothetical protein
VWLPRTAQPQIPADFRIGSRHKLNPGPLNPATDSQPTGQSDPVRQRLLLRYVLTVYNVCCSIPEIVWNERTRRSTTSPSLRSCQSYRRDALWPHPSPSSPSPSIQILCFHEQHAIDRTCCHSLVEDDDHILRIINRMYRIDRSMLCGSHISYRLWKWSCTLHTEHYTRTVPVRPHVGSGIYHIKGSLHELLYRMIYMTPWCTFWSSFAPRGTSSKLGWVVFYNILTAPPQVLMLALLYMW